MSSTVHKENGCQEPTATCALYKTIGREVWLWSKAKRASRKEVQNYAKQAFHNAGISNFKASEGWYRRWYMKWKSSEELDPKTETNTPERLNLFNENENLIDELPSFISGEDGIVDLFDGEFSFTPFENIDFYDSSLSSSYLKAEENAQTKNDSKRTQKKRSERYLPQFKTKVIEFALKNSIREAVAEFNVNKSTISDWLRSVPRNKTTESKINVDSDFIKWLQTERTRGHLVTREELTKKLNEININVLKADHWLVKYSVRLLKTEEKSRISYPRKFKKEIALLCTNYSKKKVSLVFKIDRKRIKEWVESIKDDKHVTREAKHYLTDEKIDRKIWDWYQKLTSKPSSQQIRKMALSMYHDAGYKDMTCSSGWYYRWRKRYSLLKCTHEKSNQDTDLLIWVLGQFENNKTVLHADLLNRAAQTSDTQRKPSSSWAVRFSKRFVKTLQGFPNPDIELPTILENKYLNFQNIVAGKKLLADSFLAFDEIPLNFNPSGSTKSVTLLRKSGFDNSHASLIICCRADGTFLPTTLITKSPVNLISPSIFTLVQENGINDLVTMKQWIHLITPFLKNNSVFICDIYEPHDELKNNEKFDVLFIPTGCTSKLQPISFGISQKFKDEIENQWIDSQKKSSWKSKSIQVPSLDDIHLWVLNAHAKIVENEKEFVRNCFIKAGYLLREAA